MQFPALTPSQEQVLALISAGSPISQAAQSAGVHRNTVHCWIHSQPHFRRALDRARSLKALYWREQAEQLAATAIDAIRATITDASAPAGVRLKAALSILTLATAAPPECQPASLLDLLPDSAPAESVPNSAQSAAVPPPTPAAPAPPEAAPEPAAETAPAEPVPNSAQSAAAPVPVRRAAPKIGRNDPCPCGSGKKFKRCCGLRDAASGSLHAAA